MKGNIWLLDTNAVRSDTMTDAKYDALAADVDSQIAFENLEAPMRRFPIWRYDARLEIGFDFRSMIPDRAAAYSEQRVGRAGAKKTSCERHCSDVPPHAYDFGEGEADQKGAHANARGAIEVSDIRLHGALTP